MKNVTEGSLQGDLGALTWFQISQNATIRADVMKARDGFPTALAPGNRSTGDALRLAVKELEKGQAQVMIGEGMTSSVIAAAVSGKDGSLTFVLHRQVRDAKDKVVSYEQVATIGLEKGATVPVINEEETADGRLMEALEELPERMGFYRSHWDHTQIRAVCDAFMNTIRSFRVRAGVGFVFPQKVEALKRFAACLSDLNTGRVQFSVYKLEASQINKDAILEDVELSFDDSVTSIEGAIIEAAMSGRTAKSYCKKLLEDVDNLKRTAEDFGVLLGGVKIAKAKNLDSLRGQILNLMESEE